MNGRPAASASNAAAVNRGADQIELSVNAQLSALLDQVKNNPPVRQDLVAQVKMQISNGTYETAEKIARVVDDAFSDLSDSAEALARGTVVE